MQIDLHNFFKFYDENNPKHVAAVEQFEKDLSSKASDLMLDSSNWVRIYRTPNTAPKTGIQLNVPWFHQLDNYTQPHRTCNSSCCAMCLEYFKPGTLKGPKGDDEYVRKIFSIGDTTDHSVQTRVLRSYGVSSEFRYNLSFADLDKELTEGRPVVLGILHRGTLNAPTGGHMIVCIGKTEDGKSYIFNDPYGSLNDGYSGPVINGKEVRYSVEVLRRRWTPDGTNSGWGRIFKV